VWYFCFVLHFIILASRVIIPLYDLYIWSILRM
jgi:hypothetical protein